MQPNHPAVAEILTDASARLQAATGSNSLNGYQSGKPARVRAMAEAIFMALRARVANYHEMPAGGERDWGQPSSGRSTRSSKSGRATASSLACAFASCLEQAGISPVVFFVHGHAFGGFFTEPPAGDESANRWNHPLTTSRAAISNLMDRGDPVVAVETTTIPGTATFDEAVRATREFAERSAECDACAQLVAAGAPEDVMPHLEGALDVEKAHRDGVRPLPARVVRDGIVTIVIDNGPMEPPVTEKRDAVTHRLLPDTIPARYSSGRTRYWICRVAIR